MARKPLTRAPETKKRAVTQTAVVERRLEALHTTLRLVLEPLAGRRVRVVEYRRKRDTDARWSRSKEQEGAVYAFDQLGLEPSFEELFPQAELFARAD
ncbi:MAG TPA: hypothetical protein VFF08_09770 [Trueperaceae bacterium]|nr:hypothetical protein [Trueperaceae bacterium]